MVKSVEKIQPVSTCTYPMYIFHSRYFPHRFSIRVMHPRISGKRYYAPGETLCLHPAPDLHHTLICLARRLI